MFMFRLEKQQQLFNQVNATGEASVGNRISATSCKAATKVMLGWLII